MSTERLIRLGQTYGHSCGLALSTVGRLAGGHGAFFARVAEGRVTFRRVDRAIQWFSDHWPADVRWPEDVPRPEPTPGSAAARSMLRGPEPSPRDPLETVRAARRRMATAMATGDRDGVRTAEQAAFRAGMRLGPNRRIASPGALCEALHVSRAVYYDVVRRFAHGRGPRRRTRPGSDSDRMLRALTDAGDARFACRRRPAANGRCLDHPTAAPDCPEPSPTQPLDDAAQAVPSNADPYDIGT